MNTTEKLIEMMTEVDRLKAIVKDEIAAKKEKPNKAKLNYLFSPSTSEMIKALAEDGMLGGCHSESDIARAAMHIGLSKIYELLRQDKQKASGIIHIQKLRDKLSK
jgi:hypothetical protein